MKVAKRNIVYKVVYLEDTKKEEFKSLGTVDLFNPIVHLSYVIGKKTVPIVGKLFVFKTAKDAFTYRDTSARRGIIIECETNSQIEDAPSRIPSRGDHVKDFWAGSIPFIDKRYGWETPDNTYLCNDVTPIRVVT